MLRSSPLRPARRCARRGFTLVELLVVIAIIGVLVALESAAPDGVLQPLGKQLGRSPRDVAAEIVAKLFIGVIMIAWFLLACAPQPWSAPSPRS